MIAMKPQTTKNWLPFQTLPLVARTTIPAIRQDDHRRIDQAPIDLPHPSDQRRGAARIFRQHREEDSVGEGRSESHDRGDVEEQRDLVTGAVDGAKGQHGRNPIGPVGAAEPPSRPSGGGLALRSQRGQKRRRLRPARWGGFRTGPMFLAPGGRQVARDGLQDRRGHVGDAGWGEPGGIRAGSGGGTRQRRR